MAMVGLRSIDIALLGWFWFGKASAESDYGRPVRWAEQGNRVIAETLAARAPCMITRLGSTELSVISYYLRWRRGRRVRPSYPAAIRHNITVYSGVFPTDDESLDEFSELYLSSMRETDVMGVWFNRGEQRVVAQFCGRASLVELCSLYSMLYQSPWSAQLRDKRVLVVHPFAASIESQYSHHRTQLFEDPAVLPEFELKTLAPPQTIAGNKDGFASWSDAFSQTCERIGREEYDIALIGAGAYGLPIAAFVKSEGRQAVHMGGATQLLFGIKGRRWEAESQDDIVPLFNPHWVRPSLEETPEGSSLVEGGCYW